MKRAARRKSKPRASPSSGRLHFFADPALDRMLNLTIMLAGEVWALRERVLTMEAIGIRQGAFSPQEIDDYEFTREQQESLAVQRRDYMENLFRVLQEAKADASPKRRAPARAGTKRKRKGGSR